MNRRVFRATVALLTLAGGILRAIPLGRDPLWSDEALTGLITLHAPLDLALYPLDPTPPLFYWLQALFVPADASTVVTRLPALAFGILAMPAFAWVGKLLGGRKAGVAAAALAALSPILIDYSHEARAYSLLVLLLAVTAAMALRALGPKATRRESAGFAVAGLLSLYTHVVAVFVVWPVAALLAWQGRRRGAAPGWTLMLPAMLLAFLPEAVRIVRVSRRSPSFSWLQQASPVDALDIYGNVATGLPGLIGCGVLLLLALLAWSRRGAIAEALGKRPGAGLLLAIFAVEPVLLYSVGLVGKPLLMWRAALPMLVGVLPFAALALTRAGRWQVVALGAAAASAIGGLLFSGLSRPREDWRGAAQLILAANPDFVLVCPQWQAPALLAALAEEGSWRPIILADTTRGMTLIPATGPWRETLYRTLYWDDTANLRRKHAQRVAGVEVRPGTTLALIGSCQYPDRLEGWALPARKATVWRSNRPAPVANLRIEQWVVEGPRGARQVP